MKVHPRVWGRLKQFQHEGLVDFLLALLTVSAVAPTGGKHMLPKDTPTCQLGSPGHPGGHRMRELRLGMDLEAKPPTLNFTPLSPGGSRILQAFQRLAELLDTASGASPHNLAQNSHPRVKGV